jgi:acyl carrier protein
MSAPFEKPDHAIQNLKPTDYYRADSARQAAESSAQELNGCLKSLVMTARVAPIEPATLERAAQLIQRSNQFNLTTRRYSAADVPDMIADDSSLTRAVSFQDRFGDNGLISVLLAKIVGNVLEMHTWLMSWRVLKRGVEQFLMNQLCDFAPGEAWCCAASTSQRPRTAWSATITPASASPSSAATSPDVPPGNIACTRAGPHLRPSSSRTFPMEPVRSELQEVFREEFGNDAIVVSDSTTADDIDGWDSVMHLNLITGMQKRFGVKFAAAEIAHVKVKGQNVDTLIQLLEHRLAGKRASHL